VDLTVTDDDGETATTSQSVPVSEASPYVDYMATGEILVAGTVSGSYEDTQANGSPVQSILERESGGKPANRHTWLEHKWIFNVPPGGATTTFNANAWAPFSDDGDQFLFSYSTDDSNYTPMFTAVVAAEDDDSYKTWDLDGASGTIYIRLEDTDRTPTHRSKDTVFVDHLYIRTDSTPPQPPAAPSGLSATAISSSQIDLVWTDNADNELGFYIERSPDGASWARIGSVGADATAFSDTGLDPGTMYYYQVQAHNSADVSSFSDPASATTPTASYMRVESLTPSSVTVRNKWNATVGITVIRSVDGTPVAGATVAGVWSEGATGTAECTTDPSGWCSVTKNSIKTQVPSVTFSVTGVSHATYAYDEEGSVTSAVVPQ
jgi:hypothetical protein